MGKFPMHTICHGISNFGIFQGTQQSVQHTTVQLHYTCYFHQLTLSEFFSNLIYLYIGENSVAPPGVIGEDVFIVTIPDTVSLRRHPILNLKLKLMQAGVEVGLDGPGSKAK